jgi:hypothetical protein
MAGEFGGALVEDFAVEGVAVGVHGDNGWEAGDFEFPDGFGGAEFFEEIDVADFGDAFGEDLGGAADAVKVNAAVLLAGSEGFIAHAAFADDGADAEVANDLPLVGFFADGSGGAGGGDFPLAGFIFHDDRAAVVEDAVAEIYFGRERAAFVEVFVDDIAAGKNDAAELDWVADFEAADAGFGEGGLEVDHGGGEF